MSSQGCQTDRVRCRHSSSGFLRLLILSVVCGYIRSRYGQSSLLASIANPEALARMTAPAAFEIQIAAEGSLAIMTSRASVVAVGEMFQRPRRADLSPLRQARSVVMTIGATDALARTVLRVTEADAERFRVSRRSAIKLPIVTDSARCEVASVGLRAGSMTGVALVVRRQVRWN